MQRLQLLFMLLFGRTFVPRRLQITARRLMARHSLAKHSATWPIDDSAGSPPPGWRGWPDGNQFALLLTHDVDTQRGLDRCRILMDLEERLGFRSAFYFVPRGRYEVPHELLAEMKARGFEVGVHGLYHDWWTFVSRRVFNRRAPLIRQYMKEWGAVGFRAPSMVSNLDWIRELGVEYDSSTFDTDPFEPRPEGVRTIFPFRVEASGAHPGYVEFPYTLAQDFTLFVLLQQTNIEIWKRKLAWVAQRGGLAILDIHPDYTDPDGKAKAVEHYPLRHYEDMLRHIQSQYSGQYWHVLPRDMARALPNLSPARANPASPKPTPSMPVRDKKPCIWIDLDNTPHVPLFRPIIRELEQRGYRVLVTARDAFQVVDLAARMGVRCEVVGRHYGKRKLLKGFGLCVRALQLIPAVIKARPMLAVSHGSRSQLMLSTLAGIPRVQIADYEHSGGVPLAHPNWLIVPDCISDADIHWQHRQTLRYPGIKEDVYVPDFQPNADIYRDLDLSPRDILAAVRPPATEAHYHNPESEALFFATLELLCEAQGAKVVLLPRNKKQEHWVRQRAAAGFADGRIRVPTEALDGLNLLWHSDLVVSGGGTMNREAAALGIPVYSIFRGKMGAVDRHLVDSGRLVMIENEADVRSKIRIAKRPASTMPASRETRTLQVLVDQIVACVPSTGRIR